RARAARRRSRRALPRRLSRFPPAAAHAALERRAVRAGAARAGRRAGRCRGRALAIRFRELAAAWLAGLTSGAAAIWMPARRREGDVAVERAARRVVVAVVGHDADRDDAPRVLAERAPVVLQDVAPHGHPLVQAL